MGILIIFKIKVLMAKITQEHIKKSFEIAKSIYENRITQKKGLDELVDFGMNRNSASDYVYNYQCMMIGKLMTRNSNVFGTEYYLSKIYENEGEKGLQNALISLSAHLDYYENVSNTRVLKRRKIYNKYLEKLENKTQLVFPDEIEKSEKFLEGKSKKVYVNVFERNTAARNKCIDYYGYICQICDFDFEKKYGEIGRHFIHVHHIIDISSIGAEYELNPILDLVPVCPNCHAMLHKRKPAYSLEEIKKLI
ncbi:HNH endonuclease [Winogradskyella ouciana]|uniref:HNH endonuclease n=1 Tax=Winogradskyella ouciana TaxID=2608631 RepID=A0A7K1GCT9_9FLAO|nr:HNH endonuclease [Winogradskyella ouciana]MTE25669.1 HNH endonuclease [Winogradskyella ouciana]